MQVLAVEVVVVSVVEVTKVNGASAYALSLYIPSVLIVLLGILFPAFGEILVSADGADGARPPLSGTHYGLQRRCSARVGKRSAVSGSPAELASPIRLGQRGTSLRQSRCGSPISKGKRYGRQWPAEPSTDSHLVIPPAPKGDNAREATVRCEGPTSEGRCHNITIAKLCNRLHQRRCPARKLVEVLG